MTQPPRQPTLLRHPRHPAGQDAERDHLSRVPSSSFTSMDRMNRKLAIPSRRSDHTRVPIDGAQTISNQILSILCIDVKLLRWPLKRVPVRHVQIVLPDLPKSPVELLANTPSRPPGPTKSTPPKPQVEPLKRPFEPPKTPHRNQPKPAISTLRAPPPRPSYRTRTRIMRSTP